MQKDFKKILTSILVSAVASLFGPSTAQAEINTMISAFLVDDKRDKENRLQSFELKQNDSPILLARGHSSHRSHSSHSSHRSHSSGSSRSHASHRSHASAQTHYSSTATTVPSETRATTFPQKKTSATEKHQTVSIIKEPLQEKTVEAEKTAILPPVQAKEFKLGERKIVRGDTGSDVNELVRLLIANRLLHPNFASLNKYNAQLVRAIKNMQIIVDCPADGEFDAELFSILKDWGNKKWEYISHWKNVDVSLKRSIGLYAADPAVRVAAILLAFYGFIEPYYLVHLNKADTLYDSRLSRAVKEFQREQHSEQTGLLDILVYQAIRNYNPKNMEK